MTDVDGNRVYAFGHPFYNLGPTQFPMTRAYVHTLLPSLMSSMKIASTGEVIGTVQQDVFLFSATMRDNIAYGATGATQEQVEEAAKAAHTSVQNRGMKISRNGMLERPMFQVRLIQMHMSM